MGRSIILVGIGGFLGSVARYLVAIAFAGQSYSTFPYATLAVNVLGCFLIGLVLALADRGNLISPDWGIFLTTGFCGGFTTFSSFSFENIKLLHDGEFIYLAVNIILSVAVCLAATYLGILLVRSL